jgi:hypothetical protein
VLLCSICELCCRENRHFAYYVEINPQITRWICIAEETNPIYAQKFGSSVLTGEVGRPELERFLGREWSVELVCGVCGCGGVWGWGCVGVGVWGVVI